MHSSPLVSKVHVLSYENWPYKRADHWLVKESKTWATQKLTLYAERPFIRRPYKRAQVYIRWLEREFRQHSFKLLGEVFFQESGLVRRRLRRAGAELVVDESPVDPVKPEWG